MIEAVLAALTMGLMGAGHCLGMCGGLAAALSLGGPAGQPVNRIKMLLGYNLGRVTSYSVIGALTALLLQGIDHLSPVPVLRVLSGVLLVAMGLYLGDWWKLLTLLERLGSGLWRRVSPLGQRFLPPRNPQMAFLLGAVWGWLPCGLVYSMLAFAATQPSPASAALVMASFGLGTVPAVLAGGLASESVRRWVTLRWLRRLFAVMFIVYGLVTLWPVTESLLVDAGIIHGESSGSGMHHHH